MRFDWDNKYTVEIVEFLSVETLRKIDYGILDLSDVGNCELEGILRFFEEVFTLELRLNYIENSTGIFRVQKIEDRYCYTEFGQMIEADSFDELKELVLSQNRIWYVFDERLAERHM